MTLRRSDLVTVLAEKITTDFFLAMLNPRHRGPKFRFSTFPIGEHVRSHLGINLPSSPSTKELDQADATACRTWARLIEQVGDGIPRRVQ